MNLKHIEAFRAVMVSGSMTAAAKALFTSQPNVSRLISQLERDTDLQLFQRVGVRLIPTSEGRHFSARSSARSSACKGSRTRRRRFAIWAAADCASPRCLQRA